jgi:hypothetical protein
LQNLPAAEVYYPIPSIPSSFWHSKVISVLPSSRSSRRHLLYSSIPPTLLLPPWEVRLCTVTDV